MTLKSLLTDFSFTFSEKGLKIRDISFYDADTLSVLLEVEEDGMPILVQLPISVAESQMTKVVKATLDTKGEQIIKHPDMYAVRYLYLFNIFSYLSLWSFYLSINEPNIYHISTRLFS